MKKVLLAIDGMLPDRRILAHAIAICRRIRAGLDILHMIDPETPADGAREIQRRLGAAKKYFQQAMAATAFAESGEHDTAKAFMDAASGELARLPSEADKENINYRVKVKTGDVEHEITDYLKQNKSVVLAVYDPSAAAGPEPEGLQKKLCVPLVMRNKSAA